MSQKRANRNATPKPRRERQRGRILTETGWNKLDAALQAWEVEQDCKRTFERIAAETQLDPGTIAKIFKRKEGADLGKLEQLFGTFQLTLEATDYRLVSQGMVPVADPNFVGRTQAIADLNRLIDRGTKVIVIQARGGVGKTTLARKYLQQEFESILEFPIAKETKDIASIESLLEEKLRQLGEEPGHEFFVSLDRLKRKLPTERIGILIDNLEPALDAAGKFIELHRRYAELLRVLADPSVQAVTLITSRERLNEYSISVQHYLLEELSLEAWTQFFQNRFILAADRDIAEDDSSALAALHKAYGGNAKAMDILCGTVLTDYSGHIEAYWQANQDDLLIERALEDLVVGQFERLQQLNPNAYKLLCRMGCYRYQDVPTVSIEGLFCLLWDVPENRQRRVVKSLQERSLVEFEDGRYWLHPVIRGEAIARLRQSAAWSTANKRAADFWTKSVKAIDTTEDLLRALEAYHHYIEINNTEEAGHVLVRRRPTQWGAYKDGDTLGGSLIRFGFLQQENYILNQLIVNVADKSLLCRLYRVLGNVYLSTGLIHEAIKHHEQSRDLAQDYLKTAPEEFAHREIDDELRWIEKSSLISIGICKIELWELEEARRYFEEAIIVVDDNYNQSIASYSLAFLNSYLGHKAAAERFIKKSYEFIAEGLKKSTFSGYGLILLGLAHQNFGEIDTALNLYQGAITASEKVYYLRVKAKALCRLATVYREYKNFELALSQHFKSIELSQQVEAKCDLAEAYYQFGLTHQVMGEVEKSNENFQEAIRLFSEMKAPKQVERVRQSMKP